MNLSQQLVLFTHIHSFNLLFCASEGSLEIKDFTLTNIYISILDKDTKQSFSTWVCQVILEPVHEKTNNLGFRPGLTQTGLYKHRKELEA